MLCQTPDRRRARRWLESRLWSDRGPEQASGSLRQCLMEIRKALGDEAHRLETDRGTVRLTGVTTDLEQDRKAAGRALQSGREFLEGIDITDQAFVDWLREERARVESQLGISRPESVRMPVAHVARLPFVIRLGALPPGAVQFAGQALADAIGRLLTEFAHINVYGSGGTPIPAGLPREGIALHVEGAEIRDRVHLLLSLSAKATGHIFWSQSVAMPLAQAEFLETGDLPPLVFQAVNAALAHFPRLSECLDRPCRANALIASALREMFTYDGERLRIADQLLVEAAEIADSARIHAFRVLVRQIMRVEQTDTDHARLNAEIDELSRKALERSKGNPLVLSLVGLARLMIDENPETGVILARDALALSPYNAHCHLAQAAALSRVGEHGEALAVARRGAEIAARTAHVHWWEALAGLVALRGGDYRTAIAHYEAAHSRAPGFRSAMRHLLFLYLAEGKREKAARVYRGLLRAEPEFSLERILHEPSYPAVALRNSGLVDRFGHEIATL